MSPLAIACLLATVSPQIVENGKIPTDVVRYHLSLNFCATPMGADFFKPRAPDVTRGTGYLMKVGKRAFPAYHEVLSDSSVKERIRAKALTILAEGTPDPSEFLPAAVHLLQQNQSLTTQAALKLLNRAGDATHTEHLFPLLDRGSIIRNKTLIVLDHLGKQEDAVRLREWLSTTSAPLDPAEVQRIVAIANQLSRIGEK